MQPTNAVPGITLSDVSKTFPTQDKDTPLQFWEIPEFFQCPVVGMCLTLTEQKQLLKKTKISPKNTSPFEIHEAVVASSATENRVSRRVDRLLQRKFGKQAAALFKLDASEFLTQFKSADAFGDHAAAVWATAAHPVLPIMVKREIFGQIHMSMHYSGEERMKMNRKLAGREAELEEARQTNKALAQQKRALEKQVLFLKNNQAGLQASVEAAQNEIEQLKNSEPNGDLRAEATASDTKDHFLKKKLEALYTCHQKQQEHITALKENNNRLTEQLMVQKELTQQVRQETKSIVAELVAKSRCDESCPSFDLCQKRILVVGGLSRMASLYRELIEASGGVFEYHDGYMKQGCRKLESCLRRADLVICPVSCNSHTACSLVKSLGKKHQKIVHILSNASLKAVSEALWCKGNTPYIVN